MNMKYVSLVLLVFFTSAQVLCMKYAKNIPGKTFDSTTAVLMGEVMKLIFSFILMWRSEGSISKVITQLRRNFVLETKEILKNAIPALLYTIQNNCLYIAISNLEAVIFQITSQIKLLTATIFSVIFLKKNVNALQWVSLFILGAGVILVQFDGSSSSSTGNHNVILGLVSVVIFCLTSGFAGVYMEKMFKDSTFSIWTRNFWLAFWSILIGIITLLFKDPSILIPSNFFSGYSFWTWLAIVLLAIGGLIIAMVLKYADNILKAFGNSISVILSSFLSIFLFNFKITPFFILGGFLVCAATLLYNYGGSKNIKYTSVTNPEQEKLVAGPPAIISDRA